MPRRMSCAMTTDAVRNRSKTVTRRHPDTWATLAPGDRLTLIEKGMGLPKGARQVVLAEVEIVDVRVEPLWLIEQEEGGTAAEGLGHMNAYEFVDFWRAGHQGSSTDDEGLTLCRRIEWRYLEGINKDPGSDAGTNDDVSL